MTDPLVTWSPDLQADSCWLRPLVRSLVDEATTHDVLQETWLQAWRRPPGAPAALRTWLVRVATNFAHTHRRAELRRKRHEAHAPMGEVEATSTTVERLALHRTISRAVVELPEPYRTVVLLRHYHDLDHVDIATRMVTSEDNVRQRLHRAHQMLRQRLRGELGERWPHDRAVLALLDASNATAAAPPVITAVTSAVLAMTKIRLAAAALAICGLLGVAFLSPIFGGNTEAPPAATIAGPEPATASRAADANAAEPSANVRQAVAQDGPSPPAPRISGTVVDMLGRAMNGVHIALVDSQTDGTQTNGLQNNGTEGDVLATSDANGHFVLARDWPLLRVGTLSPWVALAVQPPANDPNSREAMLVVAPGREQSLQVLDTNGSPLAGVEATVQNYALVNFPSALENATQLRWADRTSDASGRCHWQQLATVGTFLAVRLTGFEPQRLAIDATTPTELTITLRPLLTGARLVTGVVTDAKGAFVGEARIGLGARSTKSDRYGAFALHLKAGDTVRNTEALHAVASGWYTVHLAGFGATLATSTERVITQDLQLTQPVLSITGRVVDDRGNACAGVLVYPWEVDLLTDDESGEDLAAPPEAEPVSLGGNPVRAYARTEADGRFLLPGLGPRDYGLRVYDEAAQWAWTSAPIAGGSSNVLVQLPAPAQGPVAGRVLARNGQPAVGVIVQGLVEVYANGGGRVSLGTQVRTTTDADGRFRIATMPRLGVQITCSGDDWVAMTTNLDEVKDPEAMELVVWRRCHVRIECTGAAWANARAEIQDGDGHPLYLTEQRRNSAMNRESVELHEGKTGVLAVSEAAATLVLTTRDGKREQRVPVTMRPGEVNVLLNQVD